MYQTQELELLSSSSPSEHMSQDDPNQKIEIDKRFEKVVTTKNKIHRIKTHLNQLIEAMNQYPSLFSQAASLWSKIPLWQRFIVGVLLVAPLLVIGIMTNLVVLITLSIVTGVVYTAGSILLDNHQGQNTANIEGLKTGVSSLADLLDSVISAMELLREQLVVEMDAFQNENTRLTANIDQFSEQIKSLKAQINELTDTENTLRATQIELELTAENLRASVSEQSQALENTQKELDQTVDAYKKNQNQLSDKINELSDVREKMGKEVEEARAAGVTLEKTVNTFSNMILQDQGQQEAFQEWLGKFLIDKESSFVEAAARVCEAEQNLSVVTKKLEESNQLYRGLLDRQEQQIIRLEQIDSNPSNEVQRSTVVVKPSINGFYARKNQLPDLPDPIHETGMTAVM